MEYGDKKSMQSVLEEPDVKEMLEHRQIKEEDWPLVEELATMSKTMLITNFHNYFNDTKERSAKELKHSLDHDLIRDEELKRYSKIWLHFAENYHWTAIYNMERVLERRETQQ